MNVLIIPDSFKGTLSAKEAAEAIAAGIKAIAPEACCQLFPLADGGEGSSEVAAELLGAKRIELEVYGPEADAVSGFYFSTGATAYIELAAASGFSLSTHPERTAVHASTYGFGQLIGDAIERGHSEILLFLGGSATSDAGVGLTKALGGKFLDEQGNTIPASVLGGTLAEGGDRLEAIKSVDLRAVRQRLSGVSVRAAVDVKNPLIGAQGAAAVYGPQKGLTPDDVQKRDFEFQILREACLRSGIVDYSTEAGAGAAGGVGFAVRAFLGGELIPGATFFLDAIDFERRLSQAQLVICGEGRCDEQSREGKLVGAIAARTRQSEVPVWCLCGKIDFKNAVPEEFSHVHFAEIRDSRALVEPFLCLTELASETLRNNVLLTKAR